MKLDLLAPLMLSLSLVPSAVAQEEPSAGPASAVTGMMFALEGLHSVAGKGDWEIHRVSSDVVTAPGEDATDEQKAAFEPHVRVEVDLTSRAASGSAAETAFLDWEARIGREFEEADDEAWGYVRLKEVWLDRGMSGAARAKDDAAVVDRVPSGTHRSVIELKIPIDRVQGFMLPGSSDDASSAKPDRSLDPTPWLLSVAQRNQVRLGNVAIEAAQPVANEPGRWTLTAPRRDDLGLDKFRIANFLYLTSTDTRSVLIDSLEIREFGRGEFRMSVRYAEVLETDGR